MQLICVVPEILSDNNFKTTFVFRDAVSKFHNFSISVCKGASLQEVTSSLEEIKVQLLDMDLSLGSLK